MKSYDWNEIAFKNKSEIKEKNYIFIAGSREISTKRVVQLIKTYINKGNILFGILKDDYIEGFEDQPHFKSMDSSKLIKLVKKVSESKLPNSIDTIEYNQRDLSSVIEKLVPARAVFINGSWNRMFHLRNEFYILASNKIEFDLVSPFVDEFESKEYLEKIKPLVDSQVKYSKSKKYTDLEIFEIIKLESKRSFATDFQTSCAIVKNNKILALSHNEVVPYETFALHNGSVKEKNFSPANDLNFYDTVHAEMIALVKSVDTKDILNGSSLYINLMPCPTCARILSKTGIQEIVYSQDHSDGYAIKMFEMAGKTVRRFIP